MGVLRVGILGAGIVGLTTALELQREFPTADLTVVADKFNKDTTSDGAAGIFRPATSFLGPSDEVTRQWINDAYEYYNDLQGSREAGNAGVSPLSGYAFSSTNKDLVRNHYLEPLVPLYRAATEDELTLCGGKWEHGSFYTTLLVECRKFLPWALGRFEQAGGHIKKGTINSFDDVAVDFDMVVNCLGMGAKFLCSDHKMVPIRGQIIKVQAPWIRTFFYADYDTYVIPSSSGVTLGGCRHYESYDMSVSPYDKSMIMERCAGLLPSLKQAPVLQDWVGLRPHRSTVRVEPEMLTVHSKKLKVVHNYGHGGYGITSAPGTAKNAVKLVKQLHSTTSKL